MLDNSAMMFDDVKNKLKGLKKKSYEIKMAEFLKEHGHYIDEMLGYVNASENQDEAIKEVAKRFVDEVESRFATGKKHKIPQHLQVDLNFFMIYYVFPAILKTEQVQSRIVADAICTEWGMRFEDSKIGYTDYETLYNSFREKIFGIF